MGSHEAGDSGVDEFMLSFVRICSMPHRVPFSSSCVCGVHRCTRCDLLWDRLVDIGHITRITAQWARCQCACRVMWVYACHSTTAHAGDAVLVRGERGHLVFFGRILGNLWYP